MAIEEKAGEVYLVRVQLIRADSEGKYPQYIVRSFDYEVSPTTSIYQDPLFMRAEGFYKRLQAIMNSSGGRVTITGQESLRS